ncbi:MAG TPA: hypothetical protein VF493_17350 [Terriglobales bacterium]
MSILNLISRLEQPVYKDQKGDAVPGPDVQECREFYKEVILHTLCPIHTLQRESGTRYPYHFGQFSHYLIDEPMINAKLDFRSR